MAGVSAATGAMSSLIGKLAALLTDEYKLLAGVRKQIKFLERELSSMRVLLDKLAGMEEKLDGTAKDWRGKVRDLSYDIEDCIDRFMDRLGSGDAKPKFMKKTARRLKTLWARHDIATQIKDLKARVVEESERRDRYKLDEIPMKVVVIDPRITALHEEVRGLVAMDGPMKDMAVMLTDEKEKELKVVAIVGSGGLGKTTLAMEVYRKIGADFQCRASVSVSRTIDLEMLLKDILFQVDKDVYRECQSEGWRLQQVIRKTKQILTGKRYGGLCLLNHATSSSCILNQFPLSPPSATVRERGEREFHFVHRSADGRSVGLFPLRPPLRRWESGETPDPCLRLVDSRVGVPGGAGEVVAAAALWNNGAGARSPPRWRSARRRRRDPGLVSSRIDGSGEARCSKDGRCGGGDGRPVELLSLAPVFVSVWLLLATSWGCWGCCGGELVLRAGCFHRLYRRICSGVLELFAGLWRGVRASPAHHGGVGRCASVYVLCFDEAWVVPSSAGRGGEGRRFDQGVLLAVAPAIRVRAQRRACWKRGGCGEEASWPCAFSVLQLRRVRRTAHAAFYMRGVFPFPGLAVACSLLLRRCSAMKFFSRRCGGSAASSGAAVVLGFDGLLCCVFLSFLCILC